MNTHTQKTSCLRRTFLLLILLIASLTFSGPNAAFGQGWGTALTFDGKDDCVMAPGLSLFPATSITVEFWMRDAADSQGTALSYCRSPGDDALVIGGGPDFEILLAGTSVPSGFNPNDTWQHFAMTWVSSGGRLRIYRDGALILDRTGVASGASLPGGGTLVLGQKQGYPGGSFEPSQAFAGDLDELRIWGTARTAEEIQSLMWRPLTGDEPGLVAHFSLDEGSGTAAHDSGPTRLLATLVDGPNWETDTAPLRLLYFTRMDSATPQRWTFEFLDAGTGSTNYMIQFLPELSSPRVWTDLSAVAVVPRGDGLFEAETEQVFDQEGYFRIHGLRSVRVNLETGAGELQEGSGTNWLTLVFESPFVGNVGYSLGGPDSNSVGPLTGSVAVHGTRAHIPLVLHDDMDMQALRYVTLTLNGGEGCYVGNEGRQTLTIEDDDAEWQGSLSVPTGLTDQTTSMVNGVEVTLPLSRQATIDFVLAIQQSAGSCSATLKGDGYGFFPADSAPGQMEYSENRFTLSVPDISVDAGSTLLNAPLTLLLELTAENGVTNQLVSEGVIQGQATLVQEVVGQAHLSTTSTGTFELRKPAMKPSTYEVEFFNP